MSITSDIIRGHIEPIILSCLMHKDSYGYEINRTIREKTDHQYELKEATLYCAFKRLEEMGHIVSYWGDQQTGARRRYYKITEEGKNTYKQSKKDWVMSKKIIDQLI